MKIRLFIAQAAIVVAGVAAIAEPDRVTALFRNAAGRRESQRPADYSSPEAR